jgi:NADH-quinone oxidoreductase subunit K
MSAELTIVAAGVLGLVGVGLYGLLTVRNLFQVIIALQLAVKGAIIALVLAGKMSGQINLGQSLALTVIVADTIVAVVGLALAVQVKRHTGSLDVQKLSTLRR